jgi:hypothetical protein
LRRAVRHLRLLRSLVRAPGDAGLLARMAAWSVALPILKRAMPLPRLVRFAHLEPRRDSRDPEREAKVIAIAEWLFKVRQEGSRDNCLERSLVSFRFLGRLDAQPELVVGVSSEGDTTIGHVWVTIDGRPVHDDVTSVASYDQVVVFGSDGRRSELRERAPALAEPESESERVDR